MAGGELDALVRRWDELLVAEFAVVEGGAAAYDVVACAAHALISMRAPEADAALDALARSPSASLQRLAQLWS